MKYWFIILVCGILCFTCNFSVTNSIVLEDGKIIEDSQNTVNGNIYIGKGCQIKGDCRSMNGTIKIGAESQVRDVQSVNGEISIEPASKIMGSIKSINGAIHCDKGVEIVGNIATMNGAIRCSEVNIQGDIYTYRGDVFLNQKSFIHGNIVIRKGNNDDNNHPIHIVIKNATTIRGDIVVENPDLKAIVFLSKDSQILGQIKNAELRHQNS